jgi:hypothetical protein
MPLNYAEQWSPELLAIRIQETLTSPFIVPNVKWLGAKTFHFTQMSVSGFKNHVRTGGYNKGTYAQLDNEFKIEFSRDIELFIDKADVDETNATASIENIAKTLELTQKAPESDAYFFSKVCGAAKAANAIVGLSTETAVATYTKANVLTKIKEAIAKVKKYRRTVIVYVASHIMDKLELSTEIQRKIEMTQIADGGAGIETRYTSIDGVPVFECIEDDRFYDKFDFNPTDGGFEPVSQLYTEKTLTVGDSLVGLYSKADSVYTLVATGVYASGTYYEKTVGSKKINVLIATPETTVTVPKISSIYYFAPGTHTEGDGYLYQERHDYDTLIFPNGKNNKVDSIFADVDTAEYGA